MSVYTRKIVVCARKNSRLLAGLSSSRKNKALLGMAEALLSNKDRILSANRRDLQAASRKNLKKSLVDRLALNNERIRQMSDSLRQLARLPDSLGKVIWHSQRPNGITVKKVRVPIGVIMIVYEARPNVTSDCIGLLFKTSNFGVLRGGSFAINSNKAIAKVLKMALAKSGIDFSVFYLVEDTGRNVVDLLLKEDKYIDLVIPRGGEELIRKVVKISRIPVIKHYKGVCHIFIDAKADLDKALKICVNAKTQRPSVCNAVETILVHKDIAAKFLPLLKKAFTALGVEIRTGKKYWGREYLDLVVSLKVVSDVDEAIEHINTYGSHHTESIVSKDQKSIDKFLKEVDSACCFSNISTRFSDGFQFGLGAEIGISTDKLHARGPMGLEELTTYKWIGSGNGQIRE